ncbi:hypothetical protein RIF29_14350 [Crotalaria pallida]|uniref:Uncharacterized protein n=1 Tax=Crotalaria pallida TaxID=3830 RepID=A0AAN9FF78_CROPI
MQKLQPGRTILSSTDSVKNSLSSTAQVQSNIKSSGSRSALSDLTNTINASRRRLKSMLQIDDNLAIRFLAKDFDDISVKPSYNQQRSSIPESNENLSTSTDPINGHIRESFANKKRMSDIQDETIHFGIRGDFLQCNQRESAKFEGDVGTNICVHITEDRYPSPKNKTSDNKENLSTSTELENIDIPGMINVTL